MAGSTPQIADHLFHDFDDKDIFDGINDPATQDGCDNFVVEFGHDRAQIARNLEVEHFESLFHDRNPDFPIRWINIWDTSKKPEIMDFLGEKYDFSPRMINIMKKSRSYNRPSARKQVSPVSKPASSGNTHPPAGAAALESVQIVDLEQGNGSTRTSTGSEAQSGASSSSASAPGMAAASRNMDIPIGDDVRLFLLLKNKVNYSSIDQTSNALCIGAHWLHERIPPPRTNRKTDTSKPISLMPPKHWLWLVLTNDNTVLALHEDPVIDEPYDMSIAESREYKDKCLGRIRANTLSVLSQLSKHGDEGYAHKPLSQSSVRKAMSDKHGRILRAHQKRSQDTGADPQHMAIKLDQKVKSLSVEGASNLFYYLFEDYAAAATFQAAEQTLGELTPVVLESDTRRMKPHTAGIIPRLHSLGKDLRELKHLFENYKAMIQKILQTTSSEKVHASPLRSMSGLDLAEEDFGEDGVIIMAKSARERFERLGERLQWLMLNTIKGYQDETAALSDTYFNLMQQKDTAATARLNRSATLLAKLSVFFLPLNFVTSYYSIQIEEMYAAWVTWDFERAMAITVCVSFVALFFFNKLLFVLIDALDKVATRVEGAFMATGQKMQETRLLRGGTRRARAEAAREIAGQSERD